MIDNENDLRRELEVSDGTLAADADYFWCISHDSVYREPFLGVVHHDGVDFAIGVDAAMYPFHDVYCGRKAACLSLKRKLERKVSSLEGELERAKKALELVERRMAEND